MGPKLYSDSLEIEDSNCDKCIDNFYKIENTNNCINKDNIPETYYFDDNREIIGKCFENCKTCNQNKTNSSYYGCLSCDEYSILYEKSANCLNCKLRGKYAAHYENECIDFIPEGYYLEDENDKAIAKCYFSCKNCSEGGEKDNHKCIECGEDYLYRNKERTKCLPNCSEEYLYTDLQTKMCYNDCIENIVTERIYNFENVCISLEDKPEDYELVGVNNIVKKCNNLTGYFFNGECYRFCPNNTIVEDINSMPKICICNNLFYLTGKNLTCINGEECPNEYPFLKPGTKECSKCLFLYNGNCYSSCPNNTYINQTIDDLNICADIIITEIASEIESNSQIVSDKNFNTIRTEIESEIEFNSQKVPDKFFNFSDILNQIETLDNKNHLEITDYPNVTINIYIDGINIEEIDDANSKLTFINLEECGKELKNFYKLKPDENLYIVTFESFNKIEYRITNQFDFEIYLKNGTELEDLSACNNLTI
jgi:hypothetical protein